MSGYVLDVDMADWHKTLAISCGPNKNEQKEQGFPYNWIVAPESFTVEDSNVTTHLIRNAFGGLQRDLLLLGGNQPTVDTSQTSRYSHSFNAWE
jgi:hypothetical protein